MNLFRPLPLLSFLLIAGAVVACGEDVVIGSDEPDVAPSVSNVAAPSASADEDGAGVTADDAEEHEEHDDDEHEEHDEEIDLLDPLAEEHDELAPNGAPAPAVTAEHTDDEAESVEDDDVSELESERDERSESEGDTASELSAEHSGSANDASD